MPVSIDPFGQLASLKLAKTLADFASAIGYSTKGLAYILYKIPISERYTTFEIPKRSGGVRVIRAPEQRLKELQRRLAAALTSCNEEIAAASDQRRPVAHGFKKKLSILTNAWPHKRRRFVLNVDLDNFFPSINFGRVRGYFIKNGDYELNEQIATYIAQIACFQNELPQGSPCSPIISNLIAHPLDVRLIKLSKSVGCTYSRYADDLTFSTNSKIFPTKMAFQDPWRPEIWELGESLQRAILTAGFNIIQ